MHPDAEVFGVVVVAVGKVLPVRVRQQAADGYLLDVGEHLFADFEREGAGAEPVILAVVFGYEDELVAFSFGDGDFVGDFWPDDGAGWGECG